MAETIDDIQQAIRDQLADQFNVTIGEFIRKLIAAFPADKEVALRALYKKVLMGIQLDKHLAVQKFATAVLPYNTMIESKDQTFFTKVASSLEMFADLDMTTTWETAPDSTKKAMWSYVIMLARLASSHAASYADQNEEKTSAFIDAGDLAKMQRVAEMSAEMAEEFQRTRGRQVTANDDISEYSMRVAKELDLDLSALERIDLNSVKSQLAELDLSAVLPGQGKISNAQKAQLCNFVMKQLRGMQMKQRLNAKRLARAGK